MTDKQKTDAIAFAKDKGKTLSNEDVARYVVGGPAALPEADIAACNSVGLAAVAPLCAKYGPMMFNLIYGVMAPFLGSVFGWVYEQAKCAAYGSEHWCAKLPYNNRGVNPSGDNMCKLPSPEEYLTGEGAAVPDELVSALSEAAQAIAAQGVPECLSDSDFEAAGSWARALHTMMLIEAANKILRPGPDDGKLLGPPRWKSKAEVAFLRNGIGAPYDGDFGSQSPYRVWSYTTTDGKEYGPGSLGLSPWKDVASYVENANGAPGQTKDASISQGTFDQGDSVDGTGTTTEKQKMSTTAKVAIAGSVLAAAAGAFRVFVQKKPLFPHRKSR